ncbi:hypothetical protein FRC11_001578, partial [Ceratobasidium sp. 423]
MSKVLPREIVSIIAVFLVSPQEGFEQASHPVLAKDEFQKGMANANKTIRIIYMREWFRFMTLHKVEDWDLVKGLNLVGYIRVLTLKENALPSHEL